MDLDDQQINEEPLSRLFNQTVCALIYGLWITLVSPPGPEGTRGGSSEYFTNEWKSESNDPTAGANNRWRVSVI